MTIVAREAHRRFRYREVMELRRDISALELAIPWDDDPTPLLAPIRIGNHKNGTAPINCTVRNNLATAFANADEVREERNLIIHDPADLFIDAESLDLHLLPDAPTIDAGSRLNAPQLDRDRIPRPQGDGIDIGAYEWHTNDVLPVEEDPDEI